jgi:hypothetical protein
MMGMQSNIIRDLRRSPFVADAQQWRNVVHDGAYEALGMRRFAGTLSPEQVESIRAYVGSESQKLAENQRKGLPER